MLPDSEPQFVRGTARLFRDCKAIGALTAETAAQPAPRARLEEHVGRDLAHLLIRSLAAPGEQDSERDLPEARRALGSAQP